ncbi:hypothetical protein [Aureimonas sp. SK2]|uniref:hypothetical protein n=1 Tax=Aureimonas sp. SK2 TaxID=3015992 RepID=UPI002444A6E6|nr:hypothetical protein [Aureimonas sp. SK2]
MGPLIVEPFGPAETTIQSPAVGAGSTASASVDMRETVRRFTGFAVGTSTAMASRSTTRLMVPSTI